MEQKSQKTKKIREKENAILDSVSPKFNRSMIAYHETGDLFADTCEIAAPGMKGKNFLCPAPGCAIRHKKREKP